VRDRRLTRIIRQCHDLPGKRLFEYVDEGGDVRPVTSADVNEYIREASGGGFTAKDYRTWAATLGAALLLCGIERPGTVRECKHCIKQVLEQVADRLGHTVTICRTSYVHPRLLEDFTNNRLGLARQIRRRIPQPGAITVDALRAVEPIVARYLDPRKRAHA
jgi:DNA topoisomerase-1